MRQLLLVLIFLLSVPSFAQLKAGLWAGGYGSPNPEDGEWSSLFLIVRRTEGETLFGRVPQADGAEFEGTIRDGRVRFNVKYNGSKLAFDGKLENGDLVGTCRREGRDQQCLLVHEGRPDNDAHNAMAGLYETTDGDRILLYKSFHLVMENFATGEVRALYDRGNGAFTTGPAVSIPRPIESRIQIGDDTLTIEKDGKTLQATRCCTASPEPFEYTTFDGLKIRGTLHLPEGDGPFPGVLWVHGSGQARRNGAGSWPHSFTSQGMAMLAVDKRGVGESEGKYALPGGGHDNRRHMLRRAKDVREGLKALAAHEKINADHVGLTGISQAGWVIPVAAADNPLVTFNIILSGGATPISVEGVFSRVAREDASGARSISIEEALKKTRAHRPRDKDFDKFFAAMQAPSLWIYGGKDRSNPSQLCIEMIEGIRDEHERDFTLKLFPNGAHSLMEARYGGAAEYGTLAERVPGLYQTITDWMREKGLAP